MYLFIDWVCWSGYDCRDETSNFQSHSCRTQTGCNHSMYIFDITVIQSRLHNIKGHTLQERTGFPLEAFTLGKTSKHKHKSHTYFSHRITKYFELERGLISFTTSFALMILQWASQHWVIGCLSAATLQVNRSYRSNCPAGQTCDQKWERMVSDEHFDCSEAVGMAALCVAGDFKAATSTGVTKVQTGAHRHCTRHCSPGTQCAEAFLPGSGAGCRTGCSAWRHLPGRW